MQIRTLSAAFLTLLAATHTSPNPNPTPTPQPSIPHPTLPLEKNTTLHTCTIQLYSSRNGATISLKIPAYTCTTPADPLIPPQFANHTVAFEVREPCVCRLAFGVPGCGYGRERSRWVAPRSGKVVVGGELRGWSCNGPWGVGE